MWSSIIPCGVKTHWVAKARYDSHIRIHHFHYVPRSAPTVSIQALTSRRWIVADNNKLWTSSGVSAGTDAMLALIDHIYGENDQGVLFGDVISEGMEWSRVKDSEADPFAVRSGVEDVEPQ
jgi:hypothetical protein